MPERREAEGRGAVFPSRNDLFSQRLESVFAGGQDSGIGDE